MSDPAQKIVKELPPFGETEEEAAFELPELRVENTENQSAKSSSIEEREPEDRTVEATMPTSATSATPVPMPVAKDLLTHQIEKILEADLADMYFQMPAETQVKFKIAGERVTSTIRQILKSGIVKIKKILSLILDWLHMIPGVNKFFIEKEAKIKAENILALNAAI